MAIVISAVEPIELLRSLDVAKAAVLVDEVPQLLEVGLEFKVSAFGVRCSHGPTYTVLRIRL